ncbi:hypothetical protein BGZ83_004524, partial [Gryganskiella cystojenkinii]
LTFHPWISPADKKKIKDMDKHQKELELQIWRPFYQQLSQLSELKSLEIQSDQLRTSTESGILQLAEGTESLSETEGIPMTFCRAMYTTTAASSLSSSSSTTSSEAHDTDGCDDSILDLFTRVFSQKSPSGFSNSGVFNLKTKSKIKMKSCKVVAEYLSGS